MQQEVGRGMIRPRRPPALEPLDAMAQVPELCNEVDTRKGREAGERLRNDRLYANL